MVAHANTALVTATWLATLTDLPAGVVGISRPPVAKWATTGFVSLGPIFAGNREVNGPPLRWPVVQIDCVAVHPNSKKPNYPVAANLAEIVWHGCQLEPPALTLPAGVMPVHLSTLFAVSDVRQVPEGETGFAHYSIDVCVGWIEQGPVTGAVA